MRGGGGGGGCRREAAVQIWRYWSKDAALRSIGVIYVIVKAGGVGGGQGGVEGRNKKCFGISQLHKAPFA